MRIWLDVWGLATILLVFVYILYLKTRKIVPCSGLAGLVGTGLNDLLAGSLLKRFSFPFQRLWVLDKGSGRGIKKPPLWGGFGAGAAYCWAVMVWRPIRSFSRRNAISISLMVFSMTYSSRVTPSRCNSLPCLTSNE